MPSPNSELRRRRLSAKLRPLLHCAVQLKKHVAKDLPDRIEEAPGLPAGRRQRKLYLAELRRSRDQVMKAVETQGLNKSKMHVLAALTRLRQVCCHPSLVGSDTASGKTDTLFELLDTLVADGQKVLVFSQFVQMLQLLEKECQARNIHTHMLTGQTKDRQSVVSEFQKETGACVFLLSLRAAGSLGLGLTNASYVVLYDPWWNPAVEAQAIDRSHRIGQTQTVNAYRLIAPGTVEEKIWELPAVGARSRPLPTSWARKALPAASRRRIWNICLRRGLSRLRILSGCCFGVDLAPVIFQVIKAMMAPKTEAMKAPAMAPNAMFNGLLGLTGARPGSAGSVICTTCVPGLIRSTRSVPILECNFAISALRFLIR